MTGAEDTAFPYFCHDQHIAFPSVDTATEYGVVASGGNLSPGMLLSAYSQGIFPWYNKNAPLLWWSPDPRFVLYPSKFHTGKRFIRYLKKCPYTFTVDTCFDRVINACASTPRRGQDGTWVLPEMVDAYNELAKLGYAHSVEAWHNGELVGGLYGVAVGTIFCGESMFSHLPDASRAAFTAFMYAFIEAGGTLVDSQVYTDYVASFGAANVSRAVYLRELSNGLEHGFDAGRTMWITIKNTIVDSEWWKRNITDKTF